MRIRLIIAPAVFVLLAAYGAPAQDNKAATQQNPPPQTQTGPSLADAARKARETKKTEPKPAKVFTNDNLPAAGNINVIGAEAAAPADGSAAPPPSASGKSNLAQEEASWRARFAVARAKLARNQAELDVLQREMGKLQLGFYPNDPMKQLQQDLTRSDIVNQQAKIDKKQAEIAADNAAISDLEDALRKSGGDSGWAR